ncbi:MAG: MBL fold metallo-hydrolase [Pseudomonadota bacterium]
MIFRQLFDAESSTYTYLLGDATSRQALLIDPVLKSVNAYLQLLRELNLTLAYVLDTHTHADHITASGKLRELTGCTTFLGEESHSHCVSKTLSDGEKISLGKLTITALYTPGHTDDSYSFVITDNDQTYLFSGDTLLIRSTGRTDFQKGNAIEQYRSIFNKLLTLPDSTWVYPAHDYKGWMVSTIAEEKQHNPRLQLPNENDYAEFMNTLKLPDPKMMDIAVPANRSCGQI